ncbi:hypothetical protein BDV97DRAFT_395832 [Delphinella strobiligena]|nr:hypothetical protein BDV97DRAFT_395832 [Delphinella strobiligena]
MPNARGSQVERYFIYVGIDDATAQDLLRLIVPWPSSCTIETIVDELINRIQRYGRTIDPQTHKCTFYLGAPDGPTLDQRDTLADVVRSEELFVHFQQRRNGFAMIRLEQHAIRSAPSLAIRLITPEVASFCALSFTPEPPTPSIHIPVTTSIGQLHNAVAKKLGLLTTEGYTEVDLHTRESFIHPMAFGLTLEQAELPSLANEGVFDLYIVCRHAACEKPLRRRRNGMDEIYRVHPHWMPSTKQSDRGTAMLLSSLRMFCHLIKHSKTSSALSQWVLYLLDLVTFFPPAVRTMHTLLEGNTPASSDCAALSHALFCILTNMIPTRLIVEDRGRCFEGARLLFGFLFNKAKNLCSADMDNMSNPRRYVQISMGQSVDDSVDEATVRRAILLNGQKTGMLFVTCTTSQSPQSLRPLTEYILPEEVIDLQHLAAICGNLAVSRPSDLASIAAPCLTFDSKGHLAVYTGRASCANPGRDMAIFRPHYGEDMPDLTLVEQALAPIVARYNADGTDVFDVLGTPEIRRLPSPDEILMFVVDCSQSMDGSTEFLNDEERNKSLNDEISRLIDVSAYARASLDHVKASILSHEAFEDIVASVAEASVSHRRSVAIRMLQIISMLSIEELKAARQLCNTINRDGDHELDSSSKVDNLQTFVAGLRTPESALIDFIMFKAISQDKVGSWTWNIGDRVPYQDRTEIMPALPSGVTDIPVDIRCPIYHKVLQDPVIAADGHTYSLQAITDWFRISKSSPYTNKALPNTELAPDHGRADQASNRIRGKDILDAASTRIGSTMTSHAKPRRTYTSNVIRITMLSQTDSFIRVVPASMSLADLYVLAFRGMRGRHTLFQLYVGEVALEASCQTILSLNIPHGATIHIRVPNAGDYWASGRDLRDDRPCLVKVYNSREDMAFAYWAQTSTRCTLATTIVKYWRHRLGLDPNCKIEGMAVGAGVQQTGDDWCCFDKLRSDQHLNDLLTAKYASGTLYSEPLYQPKSRHSNVEIHHADDSSNDGVAAENADKVMVAKVMIHQTAKSTFRRLDVLKQMFEALMNRILAYNFSTHIGLVRVGSQVEVSQDLTHIIENFRRSVESMKAGGNTALWDALRLAEEQISQYAQKYPHALKRIICISDGDDTNSGQSPHSVYWSLRQSNVVVDSIILGDDENTDLKAISYLLGSYCFRPTDMSTALAICELEPMLSQTARPPVRSISTFGPQNNVAANFKAARSKAPFTMVTRDIYPARKEHPRLEDSCIQLADTVRRNASGGPSLFARANLRSARLLSEMRSISVNCNPRYDCYVSETDISFWKIVLEGPPDTSYAGGIFLLYLEIPENFPVFPPKSRFETKILHPNINRHGRICHSIFDRDWTTDTSLRNVLDTVYGLLFQPDYDDIVHTLSYDQDPSEFAGEVREHVAKYAKKTREEWKQELLGA